MLEIRAKRREKFAIRPLSEETHADFAGRWRIVQSHFVDDPRDSASQADHLVNQRMETRGYPMTDFEQRAADISADHPVVVENYRAAHHIARRHSSGQASTDDLRKAMVHYRSVRGIARRCISTTKGGTSMSVPMRKNEPELEEDLTTADLAQGKGPVSDHRPREDRPQPVLAGRPTGEIAQQNVQTAPTEVRNTDVRNRTDATPLFSNNELEECAIAGAAFKPLSSTSLAAPSNKQTA